MIAAVPLPAHTDVPTLAADAVSRAARAAIALAGVDETPLLDPVRTAVAYTSERWVRIAGATPVAFAPLSGFFATRDGVVRTHANYPHHRAALLRALRLPRATDRDGLAHALASSTSSAAAAAVTDAGGLCVTVRAEDPARDAALRGTPLVAIDQVTDGPPVPLPAPTAAAPLSGIRVLDLTRVIAGPVATRTLALLGADVLRIDPPLLPELAHQHLDTGHGKRTAVLDVATRPGAARFGELLESADIVALGYRGTGLDRLGLSAHRLAARRSGLIVLSLTAWGVPDRRGFDSLVQAESGIALLEGHDGLPGALPAQALDHTAGYLLAAAAMELLQRRARSGGSWHARTSLRRVAAELLGLPRSAAGAGPDARDLSVDPTGHTQTFTVDGVEVTTAAPAVRYPGGPDAFAAPRPWGRDEPAWA